MKFVLVCPGEVDGERGEDPALTQHGRRQAAALAAELMHSLERGGRVDALYTSPLRAARTTAEALSAVLDADPRTVSEVKVSPDEEDLTVIQEHQAAAWQFLLSLKEQYEQASTAVLVAHELTIRAIVCRALEMPLADMRRFDLDAASLSTIDFRLQRDGRERTLVASINDTCHVEAV